MRIDSLARAVRRAVLALGLAACASDTTSPSINTSSLRISANVSGTPIATVVVKVTAPDIQEALVFNVTVVNGTAAATLDVPPGHARTFTAQGFDASGAISHEGSATMDVVKGSNPPVVLKLRPKSGQVEVSITVGSIGLTVAPASLNLALDESATLVANPVDESGAPVTDAVVNWATTNPVVATVSSSGIVTPLKVGTAEIVATYGGVASTCDLTVNGNVADPTTEILFERLSATGGVFAISPDGTHEHQIGLTADEDPAWSPDHRSIAFSRAAGDLKGDGIWLMDASGANRFHVTARSGDHAPAWSPDGTRIAYLNGTSLSVVNVDRSAPPTLLSSVADGTSPPSWSPDSRQLAYVNASGVIAIVPVDVLAKGSTAGTGTYPAWSPDGSQILYTTGSGLSVVALNVAGMPVSRVTSGFIDTHAAWSSDGMHITFARQDQAGGTSIWTADPSGLNASRISTGTTDVAPNWK